MPTLGESVLYIDEDSIGHPALVAYIHPWAHDRPRVNLTVLKVDGRVAARQDVEPASDDGMMWIKLNKWCFWEEMPEDEWQTPAYRERQVGVTGCRAQL